MIFVFVFSGEDYHLKRYREDDRRGPEFSKRNFDHESRRGSDHDSRPVNFSFLFIFPIVIFNFRFLITLFL